MSNTFHKIYKLVKQIPKGKVSTYGEIARVAKTSPRVVGFALHANPDADNIPCHRVVNREGKLAPGFAFGGQKIQKKLLESEGVEFFSETNVDLTKHLMMTGNFVVDTSSQSQTNE